MQQEGSIMSRPGSMSCAVVALAAAVIVAPAMAKEAMYTPTGLTANKFASNCRSQGGSPSVVGADSNGDSTVNCTKKNGTSVTCSFSSDGTVCVGGGGRQQ
jgi:hypothetical protein